MKIFGLGLSKTGTTSLAHALEILGYKTVDNPEVINYNPGNLSSLDLSLFDNNDAFTDTPIPSFYQELDVRYPGSKFILTVRNKGEWLKSCKKQFNKKHADKQSDAHKQLFTDLYGCTVFNEQNFLDGYNKFVNSVQEYFIKRPDGLLIMNIASGDGWNELCPFLGKPVPDVPFPKSNVTRIRWMNINDVINIAQQAGREALIAYEFMQGDRFSLSTSKVGTIRKLGYYLQKARHHYHRDPTMAMAMDASLHTICKSLKELNPQIPIISPKQCNTVPYSERQKWNHLWLVDPLDGNSLSHDPETTLALSIALIEDRIPIIGVIHAPVIDTTYYAMAGKGAFRVRGSDDPVKLESLAYNGSGQSTDQDNPRFFTESRHKTEETSPLNALTMRMLAEGKHAMNSSLTNTMEWHTAAAQAVVSATGIKVTSCETGEQLSYNKEGFANKRIIID